ncbi:hypothetical protein AURDEDRAFT_117127 [Auricularia subglabra TFB-10046 SS5]|uniref:Uncharacterized protein n=1 Tax=Auricularia subglabra (strain TFB-10046 / SS5) TaxID=717982 RepID=J0LFS5_AURST|nr:hypothetical protein AURDEDRAFT_117127 [Auricularia subglabra TFB-10046 SS5]
MSDGATERNGAYDAVAAGIQGIVPISQFTRSPACIAQADEPRLVIYRAPREFQRKLVVQRRDHEVEDLCTNILSIDDHVLDTWRR